jgi:hypothetical protein
MNRIACNPTLRALAMAIGLVVLLASALVPPGPAAASSPILMAQDEGTDSGGKGDRADRKKDRKRSAEPAAAKDEPVVDDLDCIDFDTQEAAQAVLDADPDDPMNLDPNGDGIACALLPSAADLDPGAAASDSGKQRKRDLTRRQVEISCETLTQEEAQAEFDMGTGDPAILDPDGDGIVCETEELGEAPAENRRDRRNRNQEAEAEAEPAPDPAQEERQNRRDRQAAQEEEAAPRERNRDRAAEPGTQAPPEDLDCKDFSFQEEAQVVYDADPTDPYNLDPNADGYACSSLPSSGVRVNAIPATGAGPGGLPAAALVSLAAAGAFGIAGVRLRATR